MVNVVNAVNRVSTVVYFSNAGAPAPQSRPYAVTRLPRAAAGTAAQALAMVADGAGEPAGEDRPGPSEDVWQVAVAAPGSATTVCLTAPGTDGAETPSPVRFTLVEGTALVWSGPYEVTFAAAASHLSTRADRGEPLPGPVDEVVVVDDFYSDAHAIRNWALGQSYQKTGVFGFPGWQGAKAMSGADIQAKIERTLGRAITVDPRKYTFGGFRLISEDSGQYTTVHADGISDWAAMVYLTPRAADENGTGFFRHKATGLAGPPSALEALQLGYGSPGLLFEDQIKPQRKQQENWDRIHHVSPRFNRFIAFRGIRHYHAPLGGSGLSIPDARLTHMFFFDEARVFPDRVVDYRMGAADARA